MNITPGTRLVIIATTESGDRHDGQQWFEKVVADIRSRKDEAPMKKHGGG